MHALARDKQTLEKLRGEIVKPSVNIVSHEFDYFFDFLNEDDLLCWARDRPEFKKALNQWNMELS